jgi:hypothetical protein
MSKGSAAVVGADVVGVRGKAGNSGGVAVGIVQYVVAEKLNLRSEANVGVGDQLILPEDAFGNVAVKISTGGVATTRDCTGFPGKERWR